MLSLMPPLTETFKCHICRREKPAPPVSVVESAGRKLAFCRECSALDPADTLPTFGEPEPATRPDTVPEPLRVRLSASELVPPPTPTAPSDLPERLLDVLPRASRWSFTALANTPSLRRPTRAALRSVLSQLVTLGLARHWPQSDEYASLE
jgi:hypothetical protein